MITLEEARRILEDGEAAMEELRWCDNKIAGFRAMAGETVQCIAFARPPGAGSDYGRFSQTWAEVLPIPKAHAISALERQRSKVLARLAELGVSVGE